MRILIGCLVAIVSSAVQSLGVTLQRKAHIEEAHGYQRSATLRRWGMMLFVVANIVGSSVQLVALPLILLCALQSAGLVFNSIWASAILYESFTRMSAAGTLLVACGAALIAGLGAANEPKQNLDELLRQYMKPFFVLWVVISFAACIPALLIIGRHTHKLISGHQSRATGIAYGVVAGVLSAHSLLLAKSLVVLLVSTTNNGIRDLFRPSFWIIVGGFLLLATCQLICNDRGLAFTSSSILYPLVFCVFNCVSMVNGFLYFDVTDGSGSKARRIMWVLSGTVVLLSGVMLLSAHSIHMHDSLPGWTASDTEVEYTDADPANVSASLIPSDQGYTSLDSLISTREEAPSRIITPQLPPRRSQRQQGRDASRILSKEQSEILAEIRDLNI